MYTLQYVYITICIHYKTHIDLIKLRQGGYFFDGVDLLLADEVGDGRH